MLQGFNRRGWSPWVCAWVCWCPGAQRYARLFPAPPSTCPCVHQGSHNRGTTGDRNATAAGWPGRQALVSHSASLTPRSIPTSLSPSCPPSPVSQLSWGTEATLCQPCLAPHSHALGKAGQGPGLGIAWLLCHRWGNRGSERNIDCRGVTPHVLGSNSTSLL